MVNWIKKSYDKIIFYAACFCACGFVPWFTWSAEIMGWCSGLEFLLELAPPLFVVAFYLYARPRSKWLIALTELCAALVIVIAVLAIGRWQEVCMIKVGWDFNLAPVLPGYWVSLAIFVLLFVVLQVKVFRREK